MYVCIGLYIGLYVYTYTLQARIQLSFLGDRKPPYGCLQFFFCLLICPGPCNNLIRSWNSCTKPPLLNVRTPPPFWILDPRLHWRKPTIPRRLERVGFDSRKGSTQTAKLRWWQLAMDYSAFILKGLFLQVLPDAWRPSWMCLSLNGTFKMDANCCQRMCHFGLSLPISLKPVGGIPSHLGHKTLGKKVWYCQSLPSNFVLLGASYRSSVYWWVKSLHDIQDGVKFIWSHRCFILICHPLDCCERGYVVLGMSNSSYVCRAFYSTL